MPTGRVDPDGDVDMNPPPVYEFIKAPRLTAWDQASLVKWIRERQQYERRIKERCATTGESVDAVRVSVQTSIEPLLYEQLLKYRLRVDEDLVTDKEIMTLITKRCNELQNRHVPDIDEVFRRELRMDMSEPDVEARVVKYFGKLDHVIEKYGLGDILGTSSTSTEDYKNKMKERCRQAIENLEPPSLKTEIKRLVQYKHRAAKTSDIALFDLVLERANEQQHYHLMNAESGARRRGDQRDRTPRNTPPPPPPPPAQQQPRRPPAAEQQGDSAPRTGCWHCKGNHWLRDCPTASEDDKKAAINAMKKVKSARRVQVKAVRVAGSEPGRSMVIVNDVFELPFVADTGAECNLIPRQAVTEMRDLDILPSYKKLDSPVMIETAGGKRDKCTHECDVDLKIGTAAGNVNVRRVKCLVLEGNEDAFLMGKPTLETLGIDVDAMFAQLARRQTDDGDDIPEGAAIGEDGAGEVEALMHRMLNEAVSNGFPVRLLPRLKTLLWSFHDLFRVRLGRDAAADVAPLRVTFKDDARPYRCRQRRYPEVQSEFMHRYVEDLERFGMIRKNNQSKWASATILVKKHGSDTDFRIVNDYRPVNAMTVPIAGTMPDLSKVNDRVQGAKALGQFDLFKGFWQFPLDPSCQEQFSFMTDTGVYTPLRVPQGAMDSPLHFQSEMQTVLADQLYKSVIIWIDDVVVYAESDEQYLEELRKFFLTLRKHNLKLSAPKSTVYAKSVTFCGRVIDGEGMQQDPERVRALTSLPLPANAGELQYFLCAAGWMRESIVDYARVFEPLQQKLDTALKNHSKRAREAKKVALTWTDEDTSAYEKAKEVLASPNLLVFPQTDADVCLFTDASDLGWAAVATQVQNWDSALPVTEQKHELLTCKGGCFRGPQLNWSVIEKEAYPIVRSCGDLEYILQRPHGFRMYCDHANLIKVFNSETEMKQHVRGKLQRWSFKLVGLKYEIEHIKGSDNVWADIVSRWGPRKAADEERVLAARAVRTRTQGEASVLRPLQDEHFEWPTEAAIVTAQQQHMNELDGVEYDQDDERVTVDGKLWIPAADKELLQRVLVVAHCGIQGHRGENVMVNQLQQHYHIKDVARHVHRFNQQCLLCKHVKGGKLVQRPWSSHTTATRRNEVLHMDYLFMGPSYGDEKYLLVMKDELTHFCELIPCATPDSETVVRAILDWHKRYGPAERWMSDQGSHFKNTVMTQLQERLQGVQSFAPVYSPWLNGTVERLNRDALQVIRALLLEANLDTKSWFYVLPIVQASLNQSPVPSLADRAPIELFTGLPAPTVLDTILRPRGNRDQLTLATLSNESIDESLRRMRVSLEALHAEVVDRKEQRRLKQMAAKKHGTISNFHIGDFVLWSRVDSRLIGNKLMVRWVGPFRVVEILPYSFMIEHLLTHDRYEVHATRLKFYTDSSLNVNEEIRQHVANQGIPMAVREIVGHRRNNRTRQWEVLVSWRGLESIEDSWEPLADINADVPVLVQEYIAAHDAPTLATAVANL